MASLCVFEAIDLARSRCTEDGNGFGRNEYKQLLSQFDNNIQKRHLTSHPNLGELLKAAEPLAHSKVSSSLPMFYTFVGSTFEACDEEGIRLEEVATNTIVDERSGRRMVVRRHEYLPQDDNHQVLKGTSKSVSNRSAVVSIESFEEEGSPLPLVCRIIVTELCDTADISCSGNAIVAKDSSTTFEPSAEAPTPQQGPHGKGVDDAHNISGVSNGSTVLGRENTDGSIGGLTNRSYGGGSTNPHNVSGFQSSSSHATSPSILNGFSKESSMIMVRPLPNSSSDALSPALMAPETLIHTFFATHTPTVPRMYPSRSSLAGGSSGQLSTHPHVLGVLSSQSSSVSDNRGGKNKVFPSEPVSRSARHHDPYGTTARALDLSSVMNNNFASNAQNEEARAELLRSQQEMMKNELLRMQHCYGPQRGELEDHQEKGNVADISAIYASPSVGEDETQEADMVVDDDEASPPELTDTQMSALLDPYLVASLAPLVNGQCINPSSVYTAANGSLPIVLQPAKKGAGVVAVLDAEGKSSTYLAPSVEGLTYSSSNPSSAVRSPDPNRFFVAQPSAKSLAATSHIASAYHSGTNTSFGPNKPSQLAPSQIIYSYDGSSAHWSQKPYWFQTVISDHVQRTLDYTQDLAGGWQRWKVGPLAGMERSVIMNSIDEVCAFLRVSRNGFFAATSLLDTFLSVSEDPSTPTPNQELLDANNFRCLIIATVYVASKIHDVQPPPVKRVIEALGVQVAPDALCDMELRLFSSLHFCTHPLTLPDVTSYFSHFPLRTTKRYTAQRWIDVANRKRQQALQQQQGQDVTSISMCRDESLMPLNSPAAVVAVPHDPTAPLPLPVIDSLRANLRATLALLCDIVVRSSLALRVPTLLLGVAVFRIAIKVSKCAAIANDEEDEDGYDATLPESMEELASMLGEESNKINTEKAQQLLSSFEAHYQRRYVGHGGFMGFIVRVLRGLLGTPAMPAPPLDALQNYFAEQIALKRAKAHERCQMIETLIAHVAAADGRRHYNEQTPIRNKFCEDDDNIKSRSVAPSPMYRNGRLVSQRNNVSVSMSDTPNVAATSPSTNIGNTSFLAEDEHAVMLGCNTPMARPPYHRHHRPVNYFESDSVHVSMANATPPPAASHEHAQFLKEVGEVAQRELEFDESTVAVHYYMAQCELEAYNICRAALLGGGPQKAQPSATTGLPTSIPSILVTRYGEPFIRSMMATFTAEYFDAI